jgi:hypothetical protein
MVTSRGAPCGYPRVEELALLTTTFCTGMDFAVAKTVRYGYRLTHPTGMLEWFEFLQLG